jgi:hypothetical protein
MSDHPRTGNPGRPAVRADALAAVADECKLAKVPVRCIGRKNSNASVTTLFLYAILDEGVTGSSPSCGTPQAGQPLPQIHTHLSPFAASRAKIDSSNFNLEKPMATWVTRQRRLCSIEVSPIAPFLFVGGAHAAAL